MFAIYKFCADQEVIAETEAYFEIKENVGYKNFMNVIIFIMYVIPYNSRLYRILNIVVGLTFTLYLQVMLYVYKY